MLCCGEHRGTHFADATSTIPVSAHDWGTYFHKIDYILVSGGMEKALASCGIWDECHDGIYFSDHYPVFADFDADFDIDKI